MQVSRRAFLEACGAAVGLVGAEVESGFSVAAQGAEFARGHLVRTLPVGRFDGRRSPPLGQLLGSGLDARLFTDLSRLTPDRLIIRNDDFYVRTAFTAAVARPEPWTIDLGGRVRRASTLALSELAALEQPMGAHLLECSGNTDPANFGLLSAATWNGVRLAAVLDRLQPLSGPWRVRITGLDDLTTPTQSSTPGASWIFSRDDVERAGAFLATRMNGSVLPPNHGYPMRLVVPGWYGCTCVKWVSSIDLVADDAQATSQMREFAARTHQNGRPELARDFTPAVIDTAATPIRVEQWAIEGRVVYRVVGIMWGGAVPTDALMIRFRANEPWVRVSDCPRPASTATWTLWSHAWRPSLPGRYDIALRVADPAIRTRRLDVFFYTRSVQIDDV